MPRTRKRPNKPINLRLTAMMDVIFQLIVFFLLVMNITSAELPKVIVPELDDPQVEQPHDRYRVIVNVIANQKENAGPKDEPLGTVKHLVVGGTKYEKAQFADLTAFLKEKKEEFGNDPQTNQPLIQVDVRADYTVEYLPMQGVMQSISKAGIARFNLIAYQDKRPR